MATKKKSQPKRVYYRLMDPSHDLWGQVCFIEKQNQGHFVDVRFAGHTDTVQFFWLCAITRKAKPLPNACEQCSCKSKKKAPKKVIAKKIPVVAKSEPMTDVVEPPMISKKSRKNE